MKNQKLLAISDVADLMGVHITTVRRLANEGVLPSTRTPGGHRRFDLTDVSRFIPQRRAHMAIYAQYGDQEEIHSIAKFLEELGMTPRMSIEERGADMTRPLYSRPGFQRLAQYAGEGKIQGFVTPRTAYVGGWDQVGILSMLSKLGLPCFIIKNQALEKFPP